MQSTARDLSGTQLTARGDPRITRVGNWLRKWSIDEWPQLLNVLAGEMSLVGPRPHALSHDREYEQRISRYARRHNVKPGITGLAQVSGRNALSWDEKFALDVWYVDHWSFALDLNILLRTITRVLQPADIFQHGDATMPEFLGAEGRASCRPTSR